MSEPVWLNHRIVITAAVAAVLGPRARVRRITPVAEPGVNAWARQGRVAIQASHNLSPHAVRIMSTPGVRKK